MGIVQSPYCNKYIDASTLDTRIQRMIKIVRIDQIEQYFGFYMFQFFDAYAFIWTSKITRREDVYMNFTLMLMHSYI